MLEGKVVIITIKEIETIFRDDRVLESDRSTLTEEGLRAVWTLSTALKNGYNIQGKLDPMMGMQYEIWQLPPSCPYKFMHYEWLHGNKVSPKDYVLVYRGKMVLGKRKDMLENIFALHNNPEVMPSDYYGTSVSVSDVICLIDIDNKRSWYYVDGIGFHKLDGEWDEI